MRTRHAPSLAPPAVTFFAALTGVLACVWLALGSVPAFAAESPIALIVFDGSASMWGPLVPEKNVSEKKSKLGLAREALREVRTAIDAYKAAADAGRVAKAEGESGYPRRLEDLSEGVEDAKDTKRPRIYFLRRLPRDPFAGQPDVPAAQTWGRRSYASPPTAPAAGDDVFDVYSQSRAVGLNGIPHREW